MTTPRRSSAFGFGGAPSGGGGVARPRMGVPTGAQSPPPPAVNSGRSTPASSLPRAGLPSPAPASRRVLRGPSPLPPVAPLSGSPRASPRGAPRELLSPPPTTPSMPGSPGAMPTSVQVALRIRPITPQDATSIPTRWQRSVVFTQGASSVCVEPSSGPSSGGDAAPGLARNKKQMFAYDHVLGPEANQEDVYERAVQALVPSFVEGYNTTILAYGQTSSGKSYTMGTASAELQYIGAALHPNTGIIPRAVSDIFAEVDRLKRMSNGKSAYTVKVSFIELYNEDLLDLLADGGDVQPLVQIREDKGHIIWSGLREVSVSSVSDVMALLADGSAARRTSETDMNQSSSRSHAIFSMTLIQRHYANGRVSPGAPRKSLGLPRPGSSLSGRATPSGSGQRQSLRPGSSMATVDEGESKTIISKFHFVDLAGSERLKRTNATGDRAKEGISINSGLHALGNVISALGDPAKSKRTTHIPYRDSKLTRLLQDSLGGNAHTLMIACISATEYNVSETTNTLQYANRARNIKNKAAITEHEVGWDDLAYLQAQVTKLRKELAVRGSTSSDLGESGGALQGIAAKGAEQHAQSVIRAQQERLSVLAQELAQAQAQKTALEQSVRSSSGRKDNSDFLAAAEPIIVEYEKAIDVLEGQANLLKAAVAHSDVIIEEHETKIVEQDEQLRHVRAELAVRDDVISDLRARLGVVVDDQSSTSKAVDELDACILSQLESSTLDKSVAENVRQQLVKMKRAEASAEAYIAELETRLLSADTELAEATERVELLEKGVQERDAQLASLQSRLHSSTAEGCPEDGGSTAFQDELESLREILEAKTKRLEEIQVQMAELQESQKQGKESQAAEIASAAASATATAMAALQKDYDAERAKLQEEMSALKDRLAEKTKEVEAQSVSSQAELTRAKTDLMAAQERARELETELSELQGGEGELALLREKHEQAVSDQAAAHSRYQEAQAEIARLTTLVKPAGDEMEELNGKEILSSRGSATSDHRLSHQGSSGRDWTGSASSHPSLGDDDVHSSPAARTRRISASSPSQAQKESPKRSRRISTLQYKPANTLPDIRDTNGQHSRTFSVASRRTLSMVSHSRSTSFAFPGAGDAQLPGGTLSRLFQPPENHRDSSDELGRKVKSLENEVAQLQGILRDRDEELQQLSSASRGIAPVVASADMAVIGQEPSQASQVQELLQQMARQEAQHKEEMERLGALVPSATSSVQSSGPNEMGLVVPPVVTRANSTAPSDYMTPLLGSQALLSSPPPESGVPLPSAGEGAIRETDPVASTLTVTAAAEDKSTSEEFGTGDAMVRAEDALRTAEGELAQLRKSHDQLVIQTHEAGDGHKRKLEAAENAQRALMEEMEALKETHERELADLRTTRESILSERAQRQLSQNGLSGDSVPDKAEEIDFATAEEIRMEAERERNALTVAHNATVKTLQAKLDQLASERTWVHDLAVELQSKLKQLERPLSVQSPNALPDAERMEAGRVLSDMRVRVRSLADRSSSSPGSDSSSARTSTETSVSHTTVSAGEATSEEKEVEVQRWRAEAEQLQAQLVHCEAELRANLDMVQTLESALNDSDRNLRKARVQLGETTRERDHLHEEMRGMQAQFDSTSSELMRERSNSQQRQSDLELRMNQERQDKEKAKAVMAERLEEVARKKNSRLFCM